MNKLKVQKTVYCLHCIQYRKGDESRENQKIFNDHHRYIQKQLKAMYLNELADSMENDLIDQANEILIFRK